MQRNELPEGRLLFGARRHGFWFDGVVHARAGEGEETRAWRVLIVEDEALVALDIEVALEAAGFTVVGTVDTQDDAISATRQLQPDLVLMDITLRHGDGVTASRAIGSAASVIFVSGNTDPRTLAAARQTSPAGFLTKPFSSNELLEAVKNAREHKGRA